MPVTRSQVHGAKPPSTKKPVARKPAPKRQQVEEKPQIGVKRKAEEVEHGEKHDNGHGEPPEKKVKEESSEAQVKKNGDHPAKQSGTIERGHIYFFYRPRVELQEVHSVDDVQRFHILLVPRPPEFSTSSASKTTNADDEGDMNLLSAGADAVPAAETTGETKKHFRLISVGKKTLPDPEEGGGRGKGRKATFWATVATVGQDLKKLEGGLGGKEYETKTRGTRHQGPARIAARGAYAIVNSEGRTPSSRETHLGYHLSHPSPENFGDVQEALGIHQASSFIVQVKNPDAPNTSGARIGGSKKAEFSREIMNEVFGAGGRRGRESFGLRFASVERKDMLDYEGAELLLIAARSGEEGLEESLGEGRGEALKEVEEEESKESIAHVMKELAMDAEKIPAEALEGEWA